MEKETLKALVFVYFDQLLGAACTRKLVKILFWVFFNLFCSFFTFFSDFKSEINKKHLKMNEKQCSFNFCLLLKAGRHCKCWSTLWKGTLNLSFSVYFLTSLGSAQHPKAGRNTQQLVSCYNKCHFLDEGEKSVYYYYLPATTPTTTTTKATTTTSTTTSSPNRHRGLNGSKVALVKNWRLSIWFFNPSPLLVKRNCLDSTIAIPRGEHLCLEGV